MKSDIRSSALILVLVFGLTFSSCAARNPSSDQNASGRPASAPQSVTSTPGSGSSAGNGGGIAEKNFHFAYSYLNRAIELCVDSPAACRLLPEQEDALRNIHTSLADGSETAQILFSSEISNPGFFKIDGQIRVAKTGDHVGDPIYVNLDLIYTKGSGGRYTALDIPTASSVLVHELGHHQGIKDHQFLDQLGTRIQVLLLNKSQEIGFNPGNPGNPDLIQVTAIELNRINGFDQLLVAGSNDVSNITEIIQSNFKCSKPVNARLTGFWIKNLSWERGGSFDENTRIYRQPLQAWISPFCEGAQTINWRGQVIDLDPRQGGTLHLTLAFQVDESGSVTLMPEKTEVGLEACPSGTWCF